MVEKASQARVILKDKRPSLTMNDTLLKVSSMSAKCITAAKHMPDIGARISVTHSLSCPCIRNITAVTKDTEPKSPIIPKSINLANILATLASGCNHQEMKNSGREY